MKLSLTIYLLCGIGCLPVRGAAAQNCSGLPTQFNGNEFPNGNFFSNFDNNCYLIPLSAGNGSGGELGDLNSIYNKLYFNINPNIAPYQLIILGTFPNSRYFSISAYDDHSAFIQNLTDVNIVPLTSSYVNPFQQGVQFVSGQKYGVAINLGGTPGTLQKGCEMKGYNVAVNGMDGTQRHQAMNWNINSNFFKQNPTPLLHIVDTPGHTNPNTAGVIIIRSYLNMALQTAQTRPHVIVRDVASGCAYPAAYVLGTLNVVATNSKTGNTFLDQQQVQEHNIYSHYQPTLCWGINPYSLMQWVRSDEYTPGANSDAGYLNAYPPPNLPQTLAANGQVLRLQFRVPTTPPTPCASGCSRSGNEQLRYMSVSFEATGGLTLASLADSCPVDAAAKCTAVVQDPNGYVTLVVGTGVPRPSWVTAGNGYTWLDLSLVQNYQQLNKIAIRNILPANGFTCSAKMLPYKVGEPTTGGNGLMGIYAPVIQQPLAQGLPRQASPLTGPTACDLFPSGPPNHSPNCSVLSAPPISIFAVTTQCAHPGCNQVVVQPTLPITILGNGYGSFPFGLPYAGNSNFLQITDSTQNWRAGYTNDPCKVKVIEWTENEISVVANVNHNGRCPMAPGDALTVTVWNPQTLASASYPVTVAAQ